MQLFARITKVDEQTGKVYGRAVQEVVDRSGEIFDYETSKPNFAKWSEAAAKATDGKSVGNVRAMHGKIAAGKLTEITFNDAEKAIDVCAEVVDPVEREKCLKGVYTGFSIGGRYVGDKWPDAVHKGVSRYTAEPTEISLVDLPCVPSAMFTVVKADGAEELHKFENTTDNIEVMRKWADSLDDDAQAVLRKLFADDPAAKSYDLAKRFEAIAGIVQGVEKIAKRPDVNPKEGEKKYGDVEYADPKNKKYPIDTAEHIRAAWNYIHKGENADKYSASDAAEIKARIVAAWKDKIDPKGPPEAEKMATETAAPVAKAEGEQPDAAKMLGEASPDDLHATLDACEDDTGDDNDDALDHLDDARDAAGDSEDVAKGDFPGRPFRGNQYVGGGGSSAHHRASFRAHNATKATLGKGSSKASHEHAAAKHDRAARSAKRAGAEKQQAYHEHMAAYHTSRAARFKKDAEGDLAKGTDELQKMVAERDALAKRVAELEALPAQPKGAVRAVDKALGNDARGCVEDSPVLKADGSTDHMATAEKAMQSALRKPVRMTHW